MVSQWSLGDRKSPQVSKTFLSILTDLNNAVVWLVTTHLFIFMSSSPCINPLVTVLSVSITIGIIVTFMFHSFFFSSLARARYLSFFPLSFIHTQNLLIGWFSGFFLSIARSGRLANQLTNSPTSQPTYQPSMYFPTNK